MKHSWPAYAVLAFLAGGCASAPVRYYSLTPAAAPSSKGPSAPCCTVEMKSVIVPAEVDRPELVARYSDQQLDVLGNDLWIAPLRDEIRGALLDRIRHDLADAPTLESSPAVRRFVVTLEVQRFESVLSQHASVQVQWRVALPDATKTPPLTLCEAGSTVPVGNGIPGLVLGLQKAIAVIADQIAADILDLRRSGVSRCATSISS